MTSPRKIKSNRANAQASTGPKTAQGKARAAQSARRHGLSLSIVSDPMLSEHVESVAKEIVGDITDREIYEHARRIAEAQIDLIRIRRARHHLLVHNIDDNPECRMTEPPAHDAPPQSLQKAAASSSELAKQLVLMSRYEQRALSRRKFAIRAFDLVRRQGMTIDDAPPSTVESDLLKI
jgi:hypothetical protein